MMTAVRFCLRTRGRRRLVTCLSMAGWVGALLVAPCSLASAVEPLPAPTETITLAEALAIALDRSPDLAAFDSDVRAREAEALGAGLLPNPELIGEVENVGGSNERRGWEATETTISLGQLIELGGKRSKRHRAALLARDTAALDYDAKRLAILTEVAKAFVAVLAAQERVVLARESERLGAESVRTVASTVRAGAVSPIEEGRARVALEQSEIARTRAERELEGTRSRLAARLGATEVTFQRVSGDLRVLDPPPSPEALLATAADGPALARWTREAEQRRAALAVERARRIPDVTAVAGGRHFADDDSAAAVFGLSVPLPVFNRNQGGIGAAQAALSRTDAERRAAEVMIHEELAAGHQELLAAYEQALALRDRIVPQAEAVFMRASDAYARGLLRYLEVLDTRRTLFELRGQYVDALAEYHRTRAELERLAGRSLAGLDRAPERALP